VLGDLTMSERGSVPAENAKRQHGADGNDVQHERQSGRAPRTLPPLASLQNTFHVPSRSRSATARWQFEKMPM
jgi:hypothetical protein